MDVLQFGRWLHKQRRLCGFASQRALAEKAQEHPPLIDLHISEAFLARLEAGLLAHPFRGAVRQRVLGLAYLLCRNTRELNTYLNAASFTRLDAHESQRVALLRSQLSLQKRPQPLPLPPRPPHLFGRQQEQLAVALNTFSYGLYLITGMPGVGKSALASELLHLLASTESHPFSDGIASFSCRGYHSDDGFLRLCTDLLEALSTERMTSTPASLQSLASSKGKGAAAASNTIGQAINRIRHALTNRSLLILLDDLEADFPLRLAVEALLVMDQPHQANKDDNHPAHRMIMATSSYHFSIQTPAFHHLHLEPLDPSSAFTYLTWLLKRPLSEDEHTLAHQICAEIGYLPLALEGIAAILGTGMPLALLHAHLTTHPPSTLLDQEPALRISLERAFATLDTPRLKYFAFLSLLATPSIDVMGAAALPLPSSLSSPPISDMDYLSTHVHTSSDLSATALALSELVRHSLLDIQPAPASAMLPDQLIPSSPDTGRRSYIASDPNLPAYQLEGLYYQLHPMLRAYGLRFLQSLEPVEVEEVRTNISRYAMIYLERYKNQRRPLLRERELLFTCAAAAFRAEHYSDVIRFASMLSPISCCLSKRAYGDMLFSWGIHASQQLHDRDWQMYFMSNLGWLHHHRGLFTQAHQIWMETLALAQNHHHSYRRPLFYIAQMAHIQCEGAAAIRYLEEYLQQIQDDTDQLHAADAHILMGSYKRQQGDRDGSYQALDIAQQHLIHADAPQVVHRKELAEMHLNLELTRLQKEYLAAQAQSEAIAALYEHQAEYYDLATLLLGQASFSIDERAWDALPQMARRIVYAAEQVDAGYIRQRGLQLERQLAASHR